MSDCSDCQHNDGAVYNQSCAECEDYSKWESKMCNHPPEDAKDAARFRWSRDTQKLWTPEEYVSIVDAAMQEVKP